MMTKPKLNSKIFLKKLAILPLLLMMTFLFANKVEAQSTKKEKVSTEHSKVDKDGGKEHSEGAEHRGESAEREKPHRDPSMREVKVRSEKLTTRLNIQKVSLIIKRSIVMSTMKKTTVNIAGNMTINKEDL